MVQNYTKLFDLWIPEFYKTHHLKVQNENFTLTMYI